jgi:hypothetical protein
VTAFANSEGNGWNTFPYQQIPSGLIPPFATAVRPDAALRFRSLGPNQRELIKHYCILQPKEKSRRWLG